MCIYTVGEINVVTQHFQGIFAQSWCDGIFTHTIREEITLREEKMAKLGLGLVDIQRMHEELANVRLNNLVKYDCIIIIVVAYACIDLIMTCIKN